jgi:hypothetical protein
LARDHDGGVRAGAEGKTGLNAGIASNILAFMGGYARKAHSGSDGSLSYPTKNSAKKGILLFQFAHQTLRPPHPDAVAFALERRCMQVVGHDIL